MPCLFREKASIKTKFNCWLIWRFSIFRWRKKIFFLSCHHRESFAWKKNMNTSYGNSQTDFFSLLLGIERKRKKGHLKVLTESWTFSFFSLRKKRTNVRAFLFIFNRKKNWFCILRIMYIAKIFHRWNEYRVVQNLTRKIHQIRYRCFGFDYKQ